MARFWTVNLEEDTMADNDIEQELQRLREENERLKARRSTGEILERMTDAEWAHAAGTHTEHGPFTADRWLELTAAHAHNHAAQILVARDAAKKKP